MATIESLRSRKDAIASQYHDNADLVRDIQQQAIEELVPALKDELNLDAEGVQAAIDLLKDRVTVFRFCRRARFSPNKSFELLHSTLTWRLSSSLRSLSPSTIPSLYSTNPLFFFHPELIDRFGRPCAILNLRYVQRTEDGKLEALKDLAKLGWETGRRWLSDLSRSRRNEGKDPTLQMVVIVDLDQAGMSNLEVELLPFFMDLLKNHFPGMIGAIFVLNYGWAYAGMWQLAKRVLPNTALERILFPSKQELLEFFDEDHLLAEHGGNVQYEYSPSNPILEKYGEPVHHSPESIPPSLAPSTNVSSTSLKSEVFQSAETSRPATPSLSRRTSGLAMTKASIDSDDKTTASSSWFSGWGKSTRRNEADTGGGTGSLRRVRSLAELQAKLEETQREIDSEDSTSSEEEDSEVEEAEEGFEGEGGTGESGYPSTNHSRRSSRYSSRATSRTTSRDTSPARRRGIEPLSMSHVDLSTHAMQTMSPYNASNPHFGYPAIVPSSSLDPSGIPRPHHQRRRKRDLVRTLTYLAALRFLALHRYLRYRISFLFATLLRITGLGWIPVSRRSREGGITANQRSTKDIVDRPKVHWVESSSSLSSSPQNVGRSPSTTNRTLSSIVEIDPLYFYFTLLFLLIRTPNRRVKLKRLVKATLIEVPTKVAFESRLIALRILLGKERSMTVIEDLRRR